MMNDFGSTCKMGGREYASSAFRESLMPDCHFTFQQDGAYAHRSVFRVLARGMLIGA